MIGSILDPDVRNYTPHTLVGYFIINGNQLVIPFSEKPVSNRAFSFSKGVVRLWLSPLETLWVRHYLEIDITGSVPKIKGSFSKGQSLQLCQKLCEKIPVLSGLSSLFDPDQKVNSR